MGYLWKTEEDNILREMLSRGCDFASIGRETGRSAKGCAHRAASLGIRRNTSAPVQSAGKLLIDGEVLWSSEKEEIERLRAENSALKLNLQGPVKSGFTVEGTGYTIDKYVDPETPAEKWRKAEEENIHRIEIAKKKRQFRINFQETDYVMLVAMSDLHIAPGTPVDMRRMREDAELIRDTPRCYVMLGGDMVDNHIKHRAAVMAARSQPSDQYQHFEHLLSILSPKVTAAVAGNHDLWSNQIGGYDVLGRIMSEHRNVGYSGDEARIVYRVGGHEYRFGMRHQYRLNSSFNQTHAVKQWLRNGEEDFDVGIICHHHEVALEAFMYKGQMRWACRPGAYQITSQYSAQYGWNDAVPSCPTFVLRGDNRKIYGFPDVRDAVDYCRLSF